jgi:transposase
MIVQTPVCSIAMEACSSAHHWARKFTEMGHEVVLIAPQFVKPFVKSNKNDAADAEAICEAAQRPNMRFVPVKSIEQQEIQMIHRVRSMMVERRTAQVNQIRGFLSEFGITVPVGRTKLMDALPLIIEDPENKLTPTITNIISKLRDELKHLDKTIAEYDQSIDKIAEQSEEAKLLLTIPGIGSKTATALIAAIGTDVKNFRNGRNLAAWLGLVPRQHSTGGRNKLLSISKRGDVYLRSLFIHGARAVMRFVDKKDDALSRWAGNLKNRRHSNIAIVAMANKMARIAYAILATKKPFTKNASAANA